MNLDRYSYLWKEKKDEYVVVSTKSGYGIANKVKKSVVIINDPKLATALAQEMIKHGSKIYSSVIAAFADV